MKFWNKMRRKKSGRFLAAGLVGTIALTTFCAGAIPGLDLLNGEKIFASQQELDEVKDRLDRLEDERDAVEAELESKMEELTDLLADKEILENDMAETQAAIEQAKVDLAEAKAKEQESYEAMKVRIRYMYENGTQDSVISAILNAKGITDMINRVEYVSQVHKSDRELLESYKAKVEEVELLALGLEANMNELLTMQEIYKNQEAQIQSAVAQLEKQSEDYDTQIASAEKKAKQIAEDIRKANEAIASNNANNANSANSNTTAGDTTAGTQGTENDTANNTGSGSELTDPSQDPAYTTGVSGQDVVNFALQYVGNPYKYGGNSLTTGCDCSGFVRLVFANFGITTPRHSQSFKRIGQAVSFENIKAGDIVVYPGHVGIYIGNGNIVEAQSTRAGITCNRSVTCSTITAIRRIL